MKHLVSFLAVSCVILLVLSSGCADVTAQQKVGDFGTAFGASSDEQKAIDWFKATYGDPTSNNGQPARIIEPLITTGLDTNNMPKDKVITFPQSGGSVYFFVIYDNFKKGDPITVSWVYVENGREVTKVEKQAGGDFGRFIVEFQKPDSGWGKGRQKLTINGDGATSSVDFAIGDALQTTPLPYSTNSGAEITKGDLANPVTTLTRGGSSPNVVTTTTAAQSTVTVDTTTDINNCGALGNICPSYDLATQHARSACVAGKCTMNCLTRYSDCNKDASDGCETNVEESANHCSMCGNACNTGEYCHNGACTQSCPTGSTACNPAANTEAMKAGAGSSGTASMAGGNPSIGGGSGSGISGGVAAWKCAVLNTDPANCGACGKVCFQPPHAQPVQCNGGTCSPSEATPLLMKCQDGYLNCNGVFSDGCEVNAVTDRKNCGGCGATCPAGFHCVGNGRCCDDPTGKLCCSQGDGCKAAVFFSLAAGTGVLPPL
ncbi:MAG: hypothetical protein GYA23_08300 [Methanomicrobiales archaeon]|nr:hypothetical protein [Methanomicrobiales archaeon]